MMLDSRMEPQGGARDAPSGFMVAEEKPADQGESQRGVAKG